MFIKFVRIFFFSLLSFSSAFAIEILHSFEDLHFNPQTDLVLWDLDHTLIEPCTYEGSEPWFLQLYQTAKSTGNGSSAIDLYCAVQNQVTLRVTDEILVSKWSQWAGRVPMIGLTSRSFCLADITHEHLRCLHIPLDCVHFDSMVFPEAASHGILFTSGGVKKDFLHRILQAHPEYRFRKIIFIDDSMSHLELMEAYLQQEGIAHEVYLYQASREKYESARLIG